MSVNNIDPVRHIRKRFNPDEHLEVFFDDRVEFWGLDNVKQGENKLFKVHFCPKCNKSVTDEVVCPLCGEKMPKESAGR